MQERACEALPLLTNAFHSLVTYGRLGGGYFPPFFVRCCSLFCSLLLAYYRFHFARQGDGLDFHNFYSEFRSRLQQLQDERRAEQPLSLGSPLSPQLCFQSTPPLSPAFYPTLASLSLSDPQGAASSSPEALQQSPDRSGAYSAAFNGKHKATSGFNFFRR